MNVTDVYTNSSGGFNCRGGVRIIDTIALRRRIGQDGRSQYAIASAAGISVPTLTNMLIRGTASRRVIDAVRLALRPQMHLQTISPDNMQEWWSDENETEQERIARTSKQILAVNGINDLKYYKELSDDFDALCKKYSVIDVLETANDYQIEILNYLSACDFDLSELNDEALNRYERVEVE